MSHNTYLQLDSTYRDRKLWPNPAEFVAPFSMSGRKGQDDAVDPVTLSAPIVAWSSNFFDRTILISNLIAVTAEPVPNPIAIPPINAETDGSSLVITAVSGANSLQQIAEYYRNATIALSTAGGSLVVRRIISYKYLGANGGAGGTSDTGLITVTPNMPDSALIPGAVSTGYISDPTDLVDVNNPYFFIPTGISINNSYIEYIIYNETKQAFRKIKYYDGYTGVASVDTSGVTTFSSGPLPSAPPALTWSASDNYSIRKISPLFPELNAAGLGTQPTVTAATTSSVTINNIFLAATTDFKNYVVRLIPGVAPTPKYSYVSSVPSPPPIGEEVNILSWTYDSTTGILTVTSITPLFTAVPVVGTLAELLEFSYDNENPFVYTGSQVSQQENVCYDIKLLNLILPNLTLDVGPGGRPAFYPYFFCELSNYGTSNSGLRNVLYSNNPNASRALFVCPVYDVTNPNVSTFVNLDSDSAEIMVKFKPNDNLYLRVYLPSGQTFSTVIKDNVSPLPPNPFIQVSAVFQIRRVTNNPITK